MVSARGVTLIQTCRIISHNSLFYLALHKNPVGKFFKGFFFFRKVSPDLHLGLRGRVASLQVSNQVTELANE
jgi:hypothetical protein